MRRNHRHLHQGFSLIELVIVVVIIGIIGAIAIPRLSRGSAGASDSALIANLSVLRNAIDLYAAEHNNTFPDGTRIVDQLTRKTDINGNVEGDTNAGDCIYGPYLRSIPPLPVKSNVEGAQNSTAITTTAGAPNAGWVYNAANGTIVANSSETDAAGKAYNTY